MATDAKMNCEATIESIKTLVRAGSKVDTFFKHIEALVASWPFSLGTRYDPGVELYRATKHHRALPLTIDELWYPPTQFARLSRANRDGEPMFYCTSSPNCAFLEIGTQVGQLAVHAKWVTKDSMWLHDIGYTPRVFSRAGSRRTLPDEHRTFYERNLNEDAKIVRDFLALAFTEPTGGYYSLTAAIAEFHLRGDQFAGIRYPAVAKSANVDNVALLPKFVRTSLKLITAQLLKVDQVGTDGSIGGIVLADLDAVDANRSLRWTFRETSCSIPPGGQYAFRAGDTLRAQSPGEIVLAGRRYRIDTGYSIESTESGTLTVRDLRGQTVEPIE